MPRSAGHGRVGRELVDWICRYEGTWVRTRDLFGYIPRGTVGRGVAAGRGTCRAFAACWRTNGSRKGGGEKKKKASGETDVQRVATRDDCDDAGRVEGLRM